MKNLVWILLTGLVLAGCAKKGDSEDAEVKPIVEVTLTQVSTADWPLTLTAPATIFAREQANIAGRITAPIRRLLVRKGDNVRQGQVLMELENRDLLAQRAEAKGALEMAEATLQKTVAGTLPSDVERARGQVETTKAALAQAKQVYTRRLALYKEGAIPQRDLLQSQTDLATAQANFDVAQRSFELLQNQSRGRDEQIAKANVQQAQARLQASNAQLQFTEIRAPFSGTITDQLQYPGDMAQPTTPVFTIADLSNVNARAQVPEASAAVVRMGQPCTFTSVDSPDRKLAGHVRVVNRSIDLQRRTVEVWCEVTRPPATVRAGMFGTVSIETDIIHDAALIPKPALQQEEGTDTGIVFVVDAKRFAHKREVTIGETRGDRVRILTGLKAGETIVVEGAFGLPDRAQVVPKGERKLEEEGKGKAGKE